MVLHGRTKRLKANEQSSSQPKIPKILNGNELRAFLRPQNQSVAVEGLKALRNQLTLKPDEDNVASNDERLVLLKDWLEISPGAQDIFALMENQAQPGTVSICLSILTCILTLTSIHFVHQPLGQSIVKRLLTSQWMRKFDSQLNGVHHDTSLAAMKLLNAISAFAGRKEQKSLMESFSWDVKLFHKLLYMRRRGKETSDMLLKPDIRTLTIQFILSFVSSLSPSYVKTTLLEQHRDVLLSIFKILHMDPYSVVRFVLETLWTNIWLDQKVKRTLKIGIFGEATIQHLLKIYDRSEAEEAASADVPADLVHHFLLAICTHRGTGVCFADNGWYPRQDEETAQPDDEMNRSSRKVTGKIYNKILANVLKMLKVNDDPRQQELALKILAACPELVSGYLTSAGLTLEPRLSSKWLANIAFFGSVVSLPVPIDSFLLPLGTATSSSVPQYQPTPPPLWIIMENVMPSLNLKAHLSKAIQSTSPLVQHSAAIALAKCLQKCESLLGVFSRIEQALGEDSVTGQWARRRQEVEKETRKRVPDFQVIIAFSNTHNSSRDSEGTSDARARSVLMAEVSQRLMWLYHRCCPSLVAEARYDIAKTLATLDAKDKAAACNDGTENLLGLRRLHILNMLRESDQFVWHAKIGAHSNIYVLLHIYVNTTHGAIRDSVISLLTQTLRDSQLFQHDPEELTLWLDALPKGKRGPDAETPDGAKLTDERQSVLTFLDDCLQRCGRTPYRYLEDLSTLSEASSSTNVVEGDHLPSQGRPVNASPLMATYLEQFSAKLKSQLLTPSDALALATYIRRVTIRLLGKQLDSRLCDGITTRLSQIICDQDVFVTFPVISGALRKEVTLLHDYVDCCKSSVRTSEDFIDVDVSVSIDEFLIQVEQIAKSEEDRAEVQAYELVDWLRIVDEPLNLDSMRRLMNVVLRLYPSALPDFFDYISPKSAQLWDCILELDENLISSSLSFRVLFFHALCQQLCPPRANELFRKTLETGRADLYTFKNYCGLLLYHLNGSTDVFDGNIMQIMTLVLTCAKDILSPAEFATLKQYLFTERSELKALLCQTYPSEFLKALGPFLDQVLDCDSKADQALVSPICGEWVSLCRSSLGVSENQVPSGISAWLKYMDSQDVLDICDLAVQVILEGPIEIKNPNELPRLVERLLEVVLSLDSQSVSHWLNLKLPALAALRQRLQPPSWILNRVISQSLISTMPLGYDGHLPDSRHTSLSGNVGSAERHWKQRLLSIPQSVSLHSILQSDDWSTGDNDIVKALTYRSAESRSMLWAWFCQKDFSDTKTLHIYVPVVNALVDSYGEGEFPADKSGLASLVKLTVYLARSIFEEHEGSQSLSQIECLTRLVKHCAPQHPQLIEVLIKCSIKLRMDSVHPNFFGLVAAIKNSCPIKEGSSFVTAITNHVLQWAARCLSVNGEPKGSEIKVLKAFGEFVTEGEQLAPQYTEPVLIAITRNHLSRPDIICLARTIFNSTKLKPANVNKLLQSILQHSQFNRIVGSKARDAVLWFISSLFHSHPSNTCQPSHIIPLIQLYSGSLSTTDQLILAILQLFESEKKSSVASLLATWSPSGSSTNQNFLDVICSLEPGRVLRTILNFPQMRSLTIDRGLPTMFSGEEDRALYDPVCVLLLLAHSFSEGPPHSALSWVQLFRSNVISLTIRCLSATDPGFRLFANLQLSALWNLMQNADMQEKDQVLYILSLLRDQLPANPENPPNRLPSYITLFLAHSLRGIFYPSNFIYPITARFLLQRPELDLGDVPLLFGLLYSSSDDWKKERAWIIRFLADGMQSSEDWRLLKRRHTWDLLASLFESSSHDKPLRHGILEVLANLTCHSSATTSLILKSSLIQWMEMQLLVMKRDEAVAWAKIVENVLVVVDSEKIEKASRGEWKAGLLRCIKHLLHDCDINLVRLLSRALSRIIVGPHSDQDLLTNTLAAVVDRLAYVEEKLDCSIYDWGDESGLDFLPPHRSQNLHQLCFENNLDSWGCIVEDLWGVAMSCDCSSEVWDRLTSRLLVWRAATGERVGSVGEWARRQTISMLTG